MTTRAREPESARRLLVKKDEIVDKVQKILAKLVHEVFELNVLD